MSEPTAAELETMRERAANGMSWNWASIENAELIQLLDALREVRAEVRQLRADNVALAAGVAATGQKSRLS